MEIEVIDLDKEFDEEIIYDPYKDPWYPDIDMFADIKKEIKKLKEENKNDY